MFKRFATLTVLPLCAMLVFGLAACSEVEEPMTPTYKTGLAKN